MLHRKNGQFDADHAPDFPGPQAAGVHHVFRVNIAVIRDHVPRLVRTLLEIGHPSMPYDFGTADLGGFGVGMGHAIGIDVTFDGIVHGAGEVLLVQQRKELCRLVDGDDLQVHPEIAAARLGHLQPIEPFARAGEHQAAGDVHAAGLSGDGFNLLVEFNRVLLQLGDVGIAIHGVHAAGRVPGRPRCEFGAFDQQHVLPSRLGQVI